MGKHTKRLTHKKKIEWNAERDQAFETLKKSFTIASIIRHIHFQKLIFLETYTFDFAFRAVLSQHNEDLHLYPSAFHLQKFTSAQIIHKKWRLVIVDSFQQWRHYFEGAQHPVIVYTDYKILKYFMSYKVLNWRQTCWSISPSRFNIVIKYQPNSQQIQSDTLS